MFWKVCLLSLAIFLSLVSKASVAGSEHCEAILKHGVYDEHQSLSLRYMERVTHAVACRAQSGGFSIPYRGIQVSAASNSNRCNSNYARLISSSQDMEYHRVINRAIVEAWSDCVKTKSGLKHWFSTTPNPSRFTYTLYYDEVGRPHETNVTVNMQPQSVWETCTSPDGNRARRRIRGIHDSEMTLTCNRTPQQDVTVSVQATNGSAEKIDLPGLEDVIILRTVAADDIASCTIRNATTNRAVSVGSNTELRPPLLGEGDNELHCTATDTKHGSHGYRCYNAVFTMERNGHLFSPWGEFAPCCGSRCGRGVPYKFFDRKYTIPWPSPAGEPDKSFPKMIEF